MKKTILAILIASAMVVLTGCGAGVGTTADERTRGYKNIKDVGGKQLSDDVNVFFHADRPSRLTDKYVR